MYYLAQPPSQRPTVPYPTPFWQSPAGVATLFGAGALLVGGVAYALTRKAATCAWKPVGLDALARPGHYRIDVGVPRAALGNGDGYPTTEQEWEAGLRKMASQLPVGLTVENLWIPAIVVNGATRGPYSYPPSTPMPSDWPMATDTALHARLQILWPYSSDIAAAALPALVKDLNAQGVVISVWSCPTGPVPQALPLPIQWQAVQPDSQNQITFDPSGMYLLSAPPVAGTTLAAMVAELQSKGFTVEGSWDSGQTIPNDWPRDDLDPSRWRALVMYVGAQPLVQSAHPTSKVYAVNLPGISGAKPQPSGPWLKVMPASPGVGPVVQAGMLYRFSYDGTRVGPGHTGAIFTFFGGSAGVNRTWMSSALPPDWPAADVRAPSRLYYEGIATKTGAMPTVGGISVWTQAMGV